MNLLEADTIYWTENYAEPDLMDGIYNAKSHVNYIKSIFDLEEIEISSVVDLGFGMGHIFQEVAKQLKPYKLIGVEPSQEVFSQVSLAMETFEGFKLRLYNETIQSWLQRNDRINQKFDLAICNSVFQYIPSEELSIMIPQIADKAKFLYLTVPTNEEYKRQKAEFGFVDQFAISRSKSFYLKLLKKKYTIVSSRILESKSFYNDTSSSFSEFLFRL